MPLNTRILIAVSSLLVMLAIVHLVRRKKLDEKYAFLWIVFGILLLAGPLAVGWIDRLSFAIGIHYPPAFIFLLGFFVLFLIALQFSVAVSRLTQQNKRLAQRLAIMENRMSGNQGTEA